MNSAFEYFTNGQKRSPFQISYIFTPCNTHVGSTSWARIKTLAQLSYEVAKFWWKRLTYLLMPELLDIWPNIQHKLESKWHRIHKTRGQHCQNPRTNHEMNKMVSKSILMMFHGLSTSFWIEVDIVSFHSFWQLFCKEE